jgi:DNA end-binding protein Ku
MAPHARWNGFIKLSLVSCPVALYPAIAAEERISFRQINRHTGNRLRQQLVDIVTGEVIQSHDKGRGYQVGENRFVAVKDEELEAAREEARSRPYSAPSGTGSPTYRPEKTTIARGASFRAEDAAEKAREKVQDTKRKNAVVEESLPPPAEPIPAPPPVVNDRTIALDRFVAESEVDARYLLSPYYVVPRDEVGLEAFAVIRDAIRGKRMVGMGRVVLARRERPFIVQAMGDGLMGFTLRYAHEVRSPAEYFAGIAKLELPDEMLEVAERIIEMKAGKFDPAFLEDRYWTVLVEKLREKQTELPDMPHAAAPAKQNVIDLMEVLKRSLSAERSNEGRSVGKPKARSAAASTKASPAKRSRSR